MLFAGVFFYLRRNHCRKIEFFGSDFYFLFIFICFFLKLMI